MILHRRINPHKDLDLDVRRIMRCDKQTSSRRWTTAAYLIAAILLLLSTCHAYTSNSNNPRKLSISAETPNRPPLVFNEFQFASNGVCVYPRYFVEFPPEQQTKTAKSSLKSNYFTMRNVPGEGDCMFLAVALAAATSMGLGGNNALLRAISRETRAVVAQVLSSDGNLYIDPKQTQVPASKLLKSAVKQEPGIDTAEEYLEALRKEGRDGGLYGGGPELAVLANVLRRPIYIYEVDKPRLKHMIEDSNDNDTEKSDVNTSIFPIVCKGSFGEGIFEDPCLSSVADSAVLAASNAQPGAYSWRVNILILNVAPGEKHACVLLPQQPTEN